MEEKVDEDMETTHLKFIDSLHLRISNLKP